MTASEQKATHALEFLGQCSDIETGDFAGTNSRALSMSEEKVKEAAESFLYYYFQVPTKRPGAKRKRKQAITKPKAALKKKTQ